MVEFPADEEWIELAVEPSYLISTHGRLYGVRRRHFMTPNLHNEDRWPGKPGYYIWYVSSGQPRRKLMVPAAASVLTSFVEPRPSSNWIVRYRDGDRANLRVENLEWMPRLTSEHYAQMARIKNRMYGGNGR